MTERDIMNEELFRYVPAELSELFSRSVYSYKIVRDLRDYLTHLKPGGDCEEVEQGVWISRSAKVASTAIIYPPAIICEGAEIRHCAYIRGSVYIGRGAVAGNSTELKNAVLLDDAKAPHFNYVGDSVLGKGAHMGAGAITSNLKSTGGEVIIRAVEDIRTGTRKLGAMIGDGAEIGCGTVLNPGTVIGRESIVYPLLSVRGTVAPYSIMKDKDTVVRRRDCI